MNGELAQLLLDSARRHAPRPAVTAEGVTLTYSELVDRSLRMAAALGPQTLVAVMGTRSVHSFTAVCAALFSGAAYLPLSPKFPPDRLMWMLTQTRARALIIEAQALEPLIPSLQRLEAPLQLLVPDAGDVSRLSAALPTHEILGAAELARFAPLAQARESADGLAYVMFTSGSTGLPKGVMVTRENVVRCLSGLGERYGITCEDRFSQNFELTFDLSVFDMFLCWLHGAALCVPPAAQQMAPFKFINEAKLTVWFSVPSLARMMQGLRLLKPAAFPSLRWSLFCGERLTTDVARAWAAAASNSVVENLYGPTEVTIACTLHRFDAQLPDVAALQGSVQIGRPFRDMRCAVVDEQLRPVKVGTVGELCMAGPQVARGYWAAPDKTAERFVKMPWDDGAENRWYRTGDQVVELDGVLVFRGRNDDQVKVRGFRVELGEIEHALRSASGSAASVIAAENPKTGANELVGFVASAATEVAMLSAKLAETLPGYMVPAHILFLATLPLTTNGKVDRASLLAKWEAHRDGT